MHVLVIGCPGAGKSHLVARMRKMGLNAIDPEPGLGLTKVVGRDGRPLSRKLRGKDGVWSTKPYAVFNMQFLERALRKNKPMYVFSYDVDGLPGKKNGLLDVMHLFDKVYYLHAPNSVIAKRLRARGSNKFGKLPEELKWAFISKRRWDKRAKKLKLQVIDATLPPGRIIKIIMGWNYYGRGAHEMALKVKFRTLKSRDSKAAALLLKKVLPQLTFYSKKSINSELRGYTPKNISKRGKDKSSIFLSAWDGRRLAGLLLAYTNGGGLGYVDWMVVDPDYRRLGIAKRLVRDAEKKARRKGMHKMWWDTEISNKKMNAFNRRMGYMKVATLRDWHYHDNRYLWAKKLK